MLSRSQRLSVEQFDCVMKKGRLFHSTLFTLRLLCDQNEVGIAAVAPKKMAKTAVERNRIRRKIYEAVRPMCIRIRKCHMILLAKPGVSVAKQKDISEDIGRVFVKSGILR